MGYTYCARGYGYQAEGQGFPLPARLYDKLSSVMGELSPHEVGVLCHSLHQVHFHLQTKHAAVRQAALHCLLTYPDSFIIKDQFVVASIAKFLKKRGSENSLHIALKQKYCQLDRKSIEQSILDLPSLM